MAVADLAAPCSSGRIGSARSGLVEIAADFVGSVGSSAIADSGFAAIDCFGIAVAAAAAGFVVSAVHTTFLISHHRDTV